MPGDWELMRQGRYAEAIAAFTAAIERHGDVALHNRAKAHLMLWEHRAAADDLEACLAADDRWGRSDYELVYLGVCDWYDRRPRDAMVRWEQGLGASRTDAAGGVKVPALLLYGATRLREPGHEREALQRLRYLWARHQRRLRRAAKRETPVHVDFARPGLAAWPGAVVPFLLGLADERLLDEAVAQAGHPTLRARHACAAAFYRALGALRAGDEPSYRAAMEACAASEHGLLEHEFFLARWEVAHGFPELGGNHG